MARARVAPVGDDEPLPAPAAEPIPDRLSRGGWGWALHQGVRDPYVILITIYVFAPFLVHLVGDPVRGQQLIARISLTYGLITAATAPLIGAALEHVGRRKPLLFALMIAMLPLLCALWWAKPDGSGLSVASIALLLVALGVLFNWGDVLNNSLLPHAASARQTPLVSGLGFSLASVISLLLLVAMLWAFMLPGLLAWPLLPAAPLLGLDEAAGEPSRIAGPICAVVLLCGSLPFYLWTPDVARRRDRMGFGAVMRGAVTTLGTTLRDVRGHRDAIIFLASRMLYCDGMTALLVFGGIYAAGAMHWGAVEMLVFGISQGIFATLGGLLSPWLDRRLGPRRAVQVEIGAALCGLIAMLGMARDRILYVWTFPAGPPVLWHGPLLNSLPELVYLAIGWWLAMFVTAQNASSRTLLVHLAPPARLGSFFGLYAMSGTATVWLGSLLVEMGTTLSGSQAGGFIPVILLLCAGAAGLFFVRRSSGPEGQRDQRPILGVRE